MNKLKLIEDAGYTPKIVNEDNEVIKELKRKDEEELTEKDTKDVR